MAELAEFSRQAKFATADRTTILGDALVQLDKLDAAYRDEAHLLEAGLGAALGRTRRTDLE